MKLRLFSWGVILFIASLLLASCSKEEQEPILTVNSQHEQNLEEGSLIKLYQQIRAETALSFQEFARGERPRSLGTHASVKVDSLNTLPCAYEQELQSSYSPLYKDEYRKIMGSLSYENDLPTLEQVLALSVSDEEKIRLAIALALTSEVHAAIGNRVLDVKPDSLPTELGFARNYDPNFIARVRTMYKNAEQDCLKEARAELRHQVALATNARSSTVSHYATGGSLFLGAVGSRFGKFGTAVGAFVGYGLGRAVGNWFGDSEYETQLAEATARIAEEFNHCLDVAEEKVREAYRTGICAGRVVLEIPIEHTASVSDSIPKEGSQAIPRRSATADSVGAVRASGVTVLSK